MPNFDIGAQSLAPSQGLLAGLTPGYQAQQAAAQLDQLKLKQATAFQNGIPTTDGTPNGPIDFDAIARTQIQNGDVGGGVGLLSSGLKLNMLRNLSGAPDPLLQVGGGAGAAPGGVPAPGNAAPAGGPVGGAIGAPGGQGASTAPIDVYAHSIGNLESGNRYNALGPVQPSGDRAYGRFQVMGANIPSWTQEVLGQSMTPEQFAASPQAQDAVFKAKFGQSVQKYGNPFDAASVWFSGRPMKQAGNASDSLGTTTPAYIQKFAAGLGPAAQAVRGGQGGQGGGAPAGAPVAAAAGGGAPISFGGTPADGAPPTAPTAPASIGPTTTITAAGYQGAKTRLAQFENMDPSAMSPAQQNRASADTDIVTEFERRQTSGGGNDQPVAGARPLTIQGPGNAPAPGATMPAAPADIPPQVADAIGRLRAGQGTDADKATYIAWGRSRGQAGASPGTVAGQPVGAQDVPPGNDHPYGPTSQMPQGSRTPPPGAVPPNDQPAQPQGGPASISFGGGGAAPAPQPAPPAVPVSAAPPSVLGGGSAPAGANAGGPDLPYLQGKYAAPGGGAVMLNDLLAQARSYDILGEPQAAQVYVERAKQVQTELAAAQKQRNDLVLAQARANDRFNAMNSPEAIAAAGQRAGAEATERNKQTLVPSVQPDGSTIVIPESDALASANAGKPIMSAQPGYVTTGQGNLLTKLNDGSKAYQERQIASQRLDALSNLLETVQTGANSTAFNDAVASARSLGISIPNTATLNPGAVQEFTKNAYANVLSTMREQGNKQYQVEVKSAINSNPNPDLQPEANAAMIAQMQGIKKYYDDNFRGYSGWYHDNKGASDDADFQTGWADKHPLGDYITSAAKDIAPLGAPLPPKSQLVDGQAYRVQGQKVRWSASSGQFMPFSTSPPTGAGGGATSAPTAGARQAPDGNWYVSDPSRPGKYLQVAR